MLLGKRNSLFFSLFICEGREEGCGGPVSGGGRAFRSAAGRVEVLAMGEVNFLIGGQTHVQWPAEGLSSTGAPGRLALRRSPTRCGALTPSLIQSALHPPPC